MSISNKTTENPVNVWDFLRENLFICLSKIQTTKWELQNLNELNMLEIFEKKLKDLKELQVHNCSCWFQRLFIFTQNAIWLIFFRWVDTTKVPNDYILWKNSYPK